MKVKHPLDLLRNSSSFSLQHLDYPLLLALLLPLFAIMPLLTHAGLPNTADGPVHLMRQVELNQAWQEGTFYPRWGTDLALGHGMPIFSYAPPLLYQLTQLFHLTGLPLDEAMKAVLVFNFLLYSLGMFLFARRLSGPIPALVAAAVYVYAPYRLREAYIQGNYGQFTGLAFYPLIFWAFHGLITDGRPRYLVAAALSLAGLLLSHNISAMLFAPIFGAYLLFLLILPLGRPGPASARLRTGTFALGPPLVRTLAATCLGLGLSAIFWLPAFGERHEIKLEGITQGFFDFRENFISLPEFLSPPLPLDLTAINPEFPLSLGLPQLMGAGLGILSLMWLISHTRIKSLPTGSPTPEQTAFPQSGPQLISLTFHTLFFTLFLLLYAFLALPYSQPLWEAIPLLELAEFPWRMLGPAIFCASFLAAPATAAILRITQSLGTAQPSRAAFVLLILLFIIIALNAFYLYPSQFIPWGTPTPAEAFAYEALSGAIGTTSTGEFLPRRAQQHPQPETLWPDYRAGRPPQKLDPSGLPAGAKIEVIAHRAEADILRIDTPEPFVATLRTLYWPGWQLYLNAHPLPFTTTPETGLIQATIPAGQHHLTLKLEPTPLRTAGLWLTTGSLMVLLLIGLAVAIRRPDKALPRFSAAGDRPVASGRTTNASRSLGFFAITAAFLIGFYLLSRPLAPLFVVQSDPNHPLPADQILQADFGNRIRLVGMDDLPREVKLPASNGTDLEVTVYWRALQELETNYSVFLHLDAPNGQTFATVDEANPEDIPTRNWPPGLYLRNPLRLTIPDDIPPIRYDLNVGLYNRETGDRLPTIPEETTTFTLGSVWLTGSQPSLAGQPLARFGPDVVLLGVAYDPASPAAVTLFWQTGQRLDQNYSIFVHLLDKNGDLLGQVDGLPYAGLYPPANWQPGQIVTDVRPLPPIEPPARPAALAIGLYNPDTGQRLPATDPEGHPLPNNSYTIRIRP